MNHAPDCNCHVCQPYEWLFSEEPATPLYIGPLPHYARRMLQALDAYWLHCDGFPKGRWPRSRSTAEDWWGRFEKYRALVEGQLCNGGPGVVHASGAAVSDWRYRITYEGTVTANDKDEAEEAAFADIEASLSVPVVEVEEEVGEGE